MASLRIRPLVVGFDGMHRAGKGTQVMLLSRYLAQNSIPYCVARGDGTRRGIGSEPYDYKSAWWTSKYPTFFKADKSPQEEADIINETFQRLNRESTYLRDRFLPSISGSKVGVLVMDRTFLSRLSVMRQFYPKISIEEALKAINPKNGIAVRPLIPDVTIVLDVPKEELIHRCVNSTDQPDKLGFRMNNIMDKYEMFRKVVKEVSDLSGLGVVVINGDDTKERVHEAVMSTLKRHLN